MFNYSESGQALVQCSLNGLDDLLTEPFEKVINRKLKQKSKTKIPEETYSFSIFNLINVPQKPSLYFSEQTEEKILSLEGSTLQKKLFPDQDFKPYEDLRKCKLISRRYLANRLLPEFSMKIKEKNERQQHSSLLEQIFEQYSYDCYHDEQQREISEKIMKGKKTVRFCQESDEIDLGIVMLEFQSKLNYALSKRDVEMYFTNQRLRIIEALSPESKVNQRSSLELEHSQFLNDLLDNTILYECCSLHEPPQKWPEQFIQSERLSMIASCIDGKATYKIEEEVENLRNLRQMSNKLLDEARSCKKVQIQADPLQNPNSRGQRRFIPLPPHENLANLQQNLPKKQKHFEIQRIPNNIKVLHPPQIPNNNAIQSIIYPKGKSHRQNDSKKIKQYERPARRNHIKYEPPNFSQKFNLYTDRKLKDQSIHNGANKIGFRPCQRQFQHLQSNERKPHTISIDIPKRRSSKKTQQWANQNDSRKLGKRKQMFPYRIGPLIIESESDSYIGYHIESIETKELSMQFLIDREKYGENNVKIFVNYERVTSEKKNAKILKILRIIDCLGGCAVVESEMPYRQYNSQNSTSIFIAAILSEIPVNEAIKIIGRK